MRPKVRPASAVRWAKFMTRRRIAATLHAACSLRTSSPAYRHLLPRHVAISAARRRTRCALNQCAHAPCGAAFPRALCSSARRIVDFDSRLHRLRRAGRPPTRHRHPEDHSAEKCNFCAHRIDIGLEPACVVVCPVEAILVGDINDPGSRVAQIANREPVNVRRPEKETLPKLFYKGAHQATLDPLAARRPEGDLFMWSEQTPGTERVVSGHPGPFNNSSAAALLSYDVPHSIPWDWRVSLYTWTKGIAAGAYPRAPAHRPSAVSPVCHTPNSTRHALGPCGLGRARRLRRLPRLDGRAAHLGLEQPRVSHDLHAHATWRSWLVKALHHRRLHARPALIRGEPRGSTSIQLWLALAGLRRVLTAVYTAYLFAQAKARDLWQNPLLPPHLLVQSLLLGAAALLPFVAWLERQSFAPLAWVLAASSVLHLLMVWGEVTLTHPTAHAALAVREMTRGRYKTFFWLGVILTLVGCAAPWIGLRAVPFALAGLLLHEHAYVQAGQSVPLA